MNFDLGPDEIALRDGIREVCAKRFSMDRVRQGFDRSMWTELGEAGVFSLRQPEDQGGVGLGMTEASIVFQELGRALVPAEVARAAVDAAAVMRDDVDADPSREIAGAKLLAAEAALANAKSCIQVHGGMGFTWEVDA